MTIVDYDENREVLSVKFNTNTVWNYKNISKQVYQKIKTAADPEHIVRSMLHKSFIVGTSKKEISI